MAGQHPAIARWVDEISTLTTPERVVWCDGSESERDRLIQECVASGELIEGSPAPQRVVIIEFADAAAAKRWYNSPEYQKALPIRLANSKGRAVIVEGA